LCAHNNLMTRIFFIFPVVTGFLLWLSFPGGGGIWPILFVALIPFLAVIRKGSPKEAGMYGFTAGIVHFLFLLYWIVIVLSRYGGLHWSISVVALILLASYMSVYFALFGLLARYIFLALPVGAVLWLLPTLWVGIDWIRGILFTGLPWMDLGYGLWEQTGFIQIADLFGHHGVTWLIVFINTLLAILLTKRQSIKTVCFLTMSFVLVFASSTVYSKWRTAEISLALSDHSIKKMRVGIVQGNIDQSIKWSGPQQRDTVDRYLSLSRALLHDNSLEMLVWPETALPFYPRNNEYMQSLQSMTAESGSALLTGAPWYEIIDREARKVKFFNSALLLNPAGRLGGKYYKTHLVPFGEYVPLKALLPFLAPLVEAAGDFSPGKIENPLVWRDSRIGVLICFESVFPEISRKWVLSGANMLVNLTNDAWYGRSSAPYHSLAMSVFRAVESRRSLIRSANTGISAFITPLGNVEARSELFEPYGFSADVVLYGEKTFWARYGYLFGPLCFLLGVAASFVAIMRRRYC